MKKVLLAFGANIKGKHGNPVESIFYAISMLNKKDVFVEDTSYIYLSPAKGVQCQPSYYNMVALCRAKFPPVHLLKLLKDLEKKAGRRGGLVWGGRPLDIDIIDFNGQVLGWPRQSLSRKLAIGPNQKFMPLTYPHLQMHRRAFVLKPLREILPKWKHPVFGLSAHQMMHLNCSPLEIKMTKKLEISVKL